MHYLTKLAGAASVYLDSLIFAVTYKSFCFLKTSSINAVITLILNHQFSDIS